jgi:hypothetical protein
MGLYVETSHESDWARTQWRGIAQKWQRAGHFELVDCARDADAILITLADCRSRYAEVIERIAREGVYAEHPDKTFVFDTQGATLGLFPGLYCSLRRYLHSRERHRAGCYMQSFNEFVAPDPTGEAPELRYLFSFLGNLTAGVRRRLFETDFGRDDVLIERTEPFWSRTGDPALRGFKQRYAETLRLSRFVLCPRGITTSSFRLFETMQSGRVPVILSDGWVAPPWLDWDSCSLRVAERDVARLPEICLANLPRWEGMARQARKMWEQWFSPEGMGGLVRTSMEDIRRTRRFPETTYRLGWPMRRVAAEVRRVAVRAVSAIAR